MTAQYPDKLVNKHPRVKLDGLHLYGVIRGDPRTSRAGWGDGDAFATRPRRPSPATLCTALWRRYVATFVLQPDGRLRLAVFEYPGALTDRRTQEVDELLAGDFWMVLKPEFEGLRTYVPFQDGVVVEDRAAWFNEELRNPNRRRT